MGKNPQSVTVQYGPKILLEFDCPHCKEKISLKFRWGPQQFDIAKRR
jgi:hypothetical protein